MKTYRFQSGQSILTLLHRKRRYRPSWVKLRNSTSIGKSFMILLLKHLLINQSLKTLPNSRKNKVKLISNTTLPFKRSSKKFTLTEKSSCLSLLSCRMRPRNHLLLNRSKMRRRRRRKMIRKRCPKNTKTMALKTWMSMK